MNVPQLLILRAHVGRYRILPCKQTVAPSFSLLAISLSPLHSSRSLSLRTLPFLASRDLVVSCNQSVWHGLSGAGEWYCVLWL